MKKIVFSILALILPVLTSLACPVCEKQQPKVLQGVSHGTGPTSDWDYVIIWTMVAIVACTLYFSLKMLIKPGEHTRNHIKRTILMLENGTEK